MNKTELKERILATTRTFAYIKLTSREEHDLLKMLNRDLNDYFDYKLSPAEDKLLKRVTQ